jgi:hypothetical protein
MQTAEVIYPLIPVKPQEMVSDQLLNEVHGEVLLIRTAYATTICQRSARNMIKHVRDWLVLAATEKASFIAGKMSENGGRFQVVTRDQAIELIATWIFKEAI